MKKISGLILGDGWISGIEIKKILNISLGKKINFEYRDWKHNSLQDLQNDNLKIEKGELEKIEIKNNIYKGINKFDFIITHFAPIKKECFENNYNLKVIFSLRSGLENINIDFAKKNNIKLINNPGRNANAVKEFTIAMMLNLTRQINILSFQMKKGNWPNITSKRHGLETYIRELKSTNIGIIGYGLIGKSVAILLKKFGSNIFIYEPNKKKHNNKFNFTSLKFLLSKSDIISFHAKSDKIILNKKNFKLLKKNCFLINTSRAKLIDENLLYLTLKNKKIAGAAIDVFNQEPLFKKHPFYKLDNIILTPHIAGATDQMLIDCIYLIEKKIQKELANIDKKQI